MVILCVAAVPVDARHLAGQLEAHALLHQDALQAACHIRVGAGQDAVEELHHQHLAAEPPPHRAQLQPDHARADHQQPLGHLGQRQRAGGGHDRLLVDVDAGQLGHVRAGGDDDALGLQPLLVAVVERHAHPAGAEDGGGAVHGVDLVLLEQVGDAVDVAFDALVLERQHLRQIELRGRLYPHGGEAVPRLLVGFGGMQQGFGGDAADVEAGAPIRCPFLDHRHLEPELCRADGAHVAAGPGADNDQVI